MDRGHVCFRNTESAQHIFPRGRLAAQASRAVFVMHLTDPPACLGLCSNQSRTPHRTVGAGRRLATLPARTRARHQAISPRLVPVHATSPLLPLPLCSAGRAMDTGGGLAAGSHMRDELHVMRAQEEVCSRNLFPLSFRALVCCWFAAFCQWHYGYRFLIGGPQRRAAERQDP